MEPSLTHLRYLSAAIKTESFSRAARELSVTPQAVAKAVRSLERDLDAQLFVHDGGRVAPTEFALSLLQQLDEALRGLDDFLHYARTRRRSPQAHGPIALGIATSPTRCSVFTNADFDAYARQNPFCRLDVQLLSNGLCSASLQEGLLDAAVLFGAIDRCGIECRLIGTVRADAVMSRDHPLAHRAELSLRDLHRLLVATPLDESFAYPRLIRECIRLNVKPRFINLGASPKDLRSFLSQGGIALLANHPDEDRPRGDEVRIPFCRAEGFGIPLHFAFRAHCADRMQPLYSYLVALKRGKPLAFGQSIPLKNSSAERPSPSRILPNDFIRMSS